MTEVLKIAKEQIEKAYDSGYANGCKDGFEDGWRECNQAYEEMIGRITKGNPDDKRGNV